MEPMFFELPVLFLAQHERWLGMGRGPRHTWHPSPQRAHCPWGRGWATTAATDQGWKHSLLSIHHRVLFEPSWGGAGHWGDIWGMGSQG